MSTNMAANRDRDSEHQHHAVTNPNSSSASATTLNGNMDDAAAMASKEQTHPVLAPVDSAPINNTNNNNTTSSTTDDDLPPTNEKSAPADVAEATPPAAGGGASSPSSPEDQRTALQTTLIMLALCSGLFLAALDMTIVTTAIPTITSEFKSPSGYTWIGSAYLLANAAAAPSWGKISDIWGRKPILLFAVAVFWVGSLLCAVSVNMGMLIAARAIQGVGAGGIVVLVNITIGDLFSMRTRGMYYGMLGMVWAISSAIGPIIGGAFTTQVTWRWCFYVNLPIGGVGFAILVFVLKLHNPKTPVRAGLAAIDWLGSLLIIGGTLMFLFGLEFGGITFPWGSATVVCLIVFGVLTIVLFGFAETRVSYPVIPMRLFNQRANIAAFGTCMCHGAVFISGSYYMPLYFQAVLGASPLMSGVYILPLVLALSLTSATVGFLMKKTGKYLPFIVSGMVFMTLGFGLFIDLGAKANWAKIIIFQIIAGLGVGPNFQAPLIALQSRVQPRDIGTATATFGFIRQLATSISVVIGGVVFNNGMEKQYPMLVDKLGPELAAKLSGGSAGGSVELVASLTGENARVAKQAYWLSLRDMFILYACLGAVGTLISIFIGQNSLSKDHQEYKTGLQNLQKESDRKAEDDAAAAAAASQKNPAGDGQPEP